MRLTTVLSRLYRGLLWRLSAPWRFAHVFMLRRRFCGQNFSIIGNDCVGGILSHTLGLRFNSPTVNMWFTANDFFEYCRNLDSYLAADITHVVDTKYNYPVGLLNGKIKAYFMHYKSFDEACDCYKRRAMRVMKNKMVILFSLQFPTVEQIAEFENLPFKHKLMLCDSRVTEEKPFLVKIKNYGRPEKNLRLTEYTANFAVRRFLDQWDYVSYFNTWMREHE